MSAPRRPLGLVTAGSLLEGLQVRLASDGEPESLRAGQIVVLPGVSHDFYAMITDVRLENASPRIAIRPPGADEALLRAVLRGEATYVTLALRPLLQLPREEADPENAQVKTVPGHFTPAFAASDAEIARVFGAPGQEQRFEVGRPLDMDTPICLRLDRFIERSSGIFGKTGSGKTFLTRLLLAGLILKARDEVVTFTFDMHNEYGFGARQEGCERQVRGLEPLFPGRVVVFTMDWKSSTQRGVTPAAEVQLAYRDIEPADIYAVRDELGLSEAGCDTIGLLHDRYQEHWLGELLRRPPEELAAEIGAHEGSLAAVKRKLSRLRRLAFLKPDPPAGAEGVLQRIVTHLADRRQHVVLEFGRESSLLAYLLVANALTRRFHAEWVARSESYHATGRAADKPPHLVICVEEAHKFLNPEAARQTSFGRIARELRKYFVSLLIVDQRPSGIDDEILSQLGTRVVQQLSDERDIQAVLAGTPAAAGLKVVLAGLDSKQQALVFGHAVPMPMVLRTRAYDSTFYEDVADELRSLASDVGGLTGDEAWSS